MNSIAVSLNPTQIIGLTTYVSAMVSCSFAWAKVGSAAHRKTLTAALAVVEAALVLDMSFNGRWKLHALLDREAIAWGVYSGRSEPQIAALCLLVATAGAGIGFTVRRLQERPGASLAVCGAILSLSCWCVEVVSLHIVDAVLYHAVNGIMLVTLLWISCSLMTAGGILWDAFSIRFQQI
ncbi:MAG: hypothetical protein ABSD67_17030 [Terracidiphilus sp.]|jgi:hypothetical protein